MMTIKQLDAPGIDGQLPTGHGLEMGWEEQSYLNVHFAI